MSAAPGPEPDLGADRGLVLGTAGHIDHGKTALVAALTGRDTDRLREERERGISIALGYAPLMLPGGLRLSVVDVPGHERFVRTMVAGATGVDLFLLCVAADDGVMPQTSEHAAVLRQLGVSTGVVAITKCDLLSRSGDGRGRFEELRREVAGLAPGTEAVAVSVRSGEGIEELRAAIEQRCAGLTAARKQRQVRQTRRPVGIGSGPLLHVDRAFTLTGFGTVVTGTLWSGSIARGDTVKLLPRDLRARVRSVQVHDRDVVVAQPGRRVAVALSGVSRDEAARGDVLCGADDALEPTYLIDASLALEPEAAPLQRGTRLQVHHGTREAPARVLPLTPGINAIAPGTTAPAQLRLEASLIPSLGDRFVLRALSPPQTIGGGTVLDPAPRKHGPSAEVVARLEAIARGESPPAATAQPAPERPAPIPAPQPLDATALQLGELLAEAGRLPPGDAALAHLAGLDPARAAAALAALVAADRAVRLAPGLHIAPAPLAELEASVIELCERDGAATIAGVRDALGGSRRLAQALLEHLDRSRVTIRRGDEHVLRRRRAPAG